MADSIRPTPQRNPQLGALAALLGNVDRFARKPFGYDNPPVALLSDLLGVPALQRTAERLAYGEPLTTGRGWATRMRPDTEEAALALAGAAGPLKAAARATKGMPVGMVIKPKGGNWLDNTIEETVRPLKQTLLNEEGLRNLAARTGVENANAYQAEKAGDYALNAWLDTKLAKYIRNEMATPEDPLRALAERGVSHMSPEELERAANWVPESIDQKRLQQKFPAGGYGESLPAQGWENLADMALRVSPAKTYQNFGSSNLGLDWINKLDPDTPFYRTAPGHADELGFSHLADELRNAINPESGLPANLMWKYGDLSKVTVPQAVQRVSDINTWRAAQKAEADLARAQNAATVLHKEYPEKGYKWVELKAPDRFENPAQQEEFGDLRRYANKRLSEALKYEGDTMGHCVGGGDYCSDVLEGRSRIFSLRSAKGEPHVTIEVAPGHRSPEGAVPADQLPEDVLADFKARNILDPRHAYVYDEAAGRYLPTLASSPDRIVQIKGKANRAPNPEYLPFVQDFVKSGKWSDVGDLRNTGLKQWTPTLQDIPMSVTGAIPRLGDIPHGYYTEDELVNLIRDWQGTQGKPGYAEGGPVTQNPTAYNPAKIDAILNSLREELHG